MMVYVGTFTPSRGGRAEGIYVFRMDPETGALAPVQTVPDVESPSWVALHPSGRFLYSSNAVEDGGVSAFAVDPSAGTLSFLNRQSSGGASPAHVSVDPSGRWALAANYGSGHVAVLPIGQDGRLGAPSDVRRHEGPPGPNAQRQDGPHAHQIRFDPNGRFVLANDLGLDRTFVYRFDAENGKLIPNDPPYATAQPGSGPRHLAFHPSSRYLYVLNEIGATVNVFSYDAATGAPSHLEVVATTPDGFQDRNSTAQILVHPNGRFVYASNRGHDSIAIFRVDEATGRLTPIGHESTRGKTPRNFNFDPSGRFLLAANQDSDTIVTFRVDPESGRLEATGAIAECATPTCLEFRSDE